MKLICIFLTIVRSIWGSSTSALILQTDEKNDLYIHDQVESIVRKDTGTIKS